MAFGISCSLPLRMAEPPRTGLTPSPSPPEMPKALRCSPKRYLPTLASCGLSDNVFYGKQKWPREKSFNISLGSNGTRCSNQDSGGRRVGFIGCFGVDCFFFIFFKGGLYEYAFC